MRSFRKRKSLWGQLYGLGDMNTHEMIKSLKYHFQHILRWNPRLFYMGLLRAIPDLLIPTLGILIPALVLKGIEEGWTIERYVGYIGSMIMLLLIVNLLNAKIQSVLTAQFDQYRCQYFTLLCEKQMTVDYDILENPYFQNKKQMAYFWIREWAYGGPVEKLVSAFGILIASVICLAIYGVLLVQVSGWLLVLIGVSVLISIGMTTKALVDEQGYWEQSAAIRRKNGYISRHTMTLSEGKDMRLYGMEEWLMAMFSRFSKMIERHLSKAQRMYCLETIVYCILVCLRDGIAYSYLVVQIISGQMCVSDFVLYTGLVAGFSVWFRKFIEELQNIFRGAYAFFAVRQFLEITNRWKGAYMQLTAEETSDEGVSITFQDVSFRYDEKKNILSHVNLTIKKGERLALVGLNGAGKTTLVKLLCGFYEPNEGVILVNDRPIREYDRETYYQMISAVFQDAGILPNSILENVSCKKAEETDYKKAMACMERAGLSEKIAQLPLKEETCLVRELSGKAIELSGGEKQKLLLARALYKGGKFLILDEPTAALDPIAENEIYLKYHELTEGKTSLYISHRLSSTRFCDRIMLLEDGKIIEEGTHDELMALKGKYAQMFCLQSQYYEESYRKQKVGDELAIS